ncbi:MAG: hypothetical protein ACK4FJ_05540 [Ferrovibrio sp.]|uniref:hypothetical protein n=1 Tax=Ferrovibrio sp. TaxID=1917215 RepID=UPI00391A88CA
MGVAAKATPTAPFPRQTPTSLFGGSVSPWPAFIPAEVRGELDAMRIKADRAGIGVTLPWSHRDLQGFITFQAADRSACRRYRVTTNRGMELINLGFAEICGD